VCKFLGHSPSRRFISAMTYTLHVRARCSIVMPIPSHCPTNGRFQAVARDQCRAN